MLSLEPATIADRRYPLIFQTGETAYGAALVDSQHPHNFHHVVGIPLRASSCRRHDARPVLCTGGRSGTWADGVSAPRLGNGTAASDDFPPLAGLHTYRRRGGDGGDPA